MIDYLGCIIVRLVSAVFMLVPAGVRLWIGRRAGELFYLFHRKRRTIAYSNLKAAFCKTKSPKELRRITKGVYRNMGQILVEVLTLPAVDTRYINRYIKCTGLEHISRALERGKGIILLTAHFGNWELSSFVGTAKVKPIYVFARGQKHTRLNELLNKYRESSGGRVITKGMATRQVIKRLRENEIVGILADQDAGKNGVFCEFFGRPTSTAGGAISFAMHTGAVVLPTFLIREKGPYHHQIVEGPLEIPNTGDEEKDVKEALQKFARRLEYYVRQYPDQWLWVHKRWKSTPKKSILILSDGKAGHLNQSLAVSDCIARYREGKGYGREYTKQKVVEVKFKSRLHKFLSMPCSLFTNQWCQGCMYCLKFNLTKESYDGLMANFADIVISCGASQGPINILLAIENKAKAINIMKPASSLTRKFDLVIAPRHDRIKRRKNVLVVDGSPNLIDEDSLARFSKELAGQLNLDERIKLGLLIGGDNLDYSIGCDLAKDVFSGVIETANKMDWEILATTSRRTSKDVEGLASQMLGSNPRCKLLVIANEKNIPNVIPGILGLCDIVVVSGESTSMVSEAVSSGKRIIVFPAHKKNPKKLTKHDRLLKDFQDKRYVVVAESAHLGEEILKVYAAKSTIKQPDIRNIICEAVGKLI